MSNSILKRMKKVKYETGIKSSGRVMKPFFSVVLPTYNRRKQIERCLRSIDLQTFQDYEVIVVDDGSTDDTAHFISDSYPHVTYFRQKNQGVSKARNTGIEMARGRYIAFIDSDDVWYAHRLDVLYRVIKKLPENIGIVFNDLDKLEEEKGTRHSYSDNYFGVTRSRVLNEMIKKCPMDWSGSSLTISYGNIFRGLLHGNVIQPSCAVMNKEVYSQVGGFREDYRVANDSEYFLRVSKEFQVAFVPMILTSLDPPRSKISLSLSSNSIEKIENMISTIGSYRAQEENPTLKKHLQVRLSGLHSLLGYHYLSEYDVKHCRAHYKESLRLTPLRIKNYIMLFMSMLPMWVLDTLANLKRKLK